MRKKANKRKQEKKEQKSYLTVMIIEGKKRNFETGKKSRHTRRESIYKQKSRGKEGNKVNSGKKIENEKKKIMKRREEEKEKMNQGQVENRKDDKKQRKIYNQGVGNTTNT